MSLIAPVFRNDISVRNTEAYPTPGAGPGYYCIGDNIVSAGTITMPSPNNPDGVLINYETAASLSAIAGLEGDKNYIRAMNVTAYIRYKILQSSNERVFIGFTDQPFTTMLGSDNPAGNYHGLSYSTTRDAGNIYAIRKDGTTFNSNKIQSIDNLAHDLYLSMFSDSAPNPEVVIHVDDTWINAVMIAPGIPLNTTPLMFMAGIKTLDSNAKDLRTGKIIVQQSY